MKKQAAKRRKPVRRKRPADARKASLSASDIGAIRQRLMESLIEDGSLEDGGLEEMIEELLAAELDEPDDTLDPEMLSEFGEALEEARVNANGGDPGARETLEAVRAVIDKAARRDEIDPRMLMMLGQVFAAARLDIGDAARASMARILKSAGSDGLKEELFPFVSGAYSAGRATMTRSRSTTSSPRSSISFRQITKPRRSQGWRPGRTRWDGGSPSDSCCIQRSWWRWRRFAGWPGRTLAAIWNLKAAAGFE